MAPRAVVVPAPRTDERRARRCLSELARAHGRAEAGIAPLAEDGSHEALPFVSFALDVVADGEQTIGALVEEREPVSYPHAAAIVDRIATALERAHAHDPPSVLGHLCWSNVWIDREGAVHLVGLGHNIVALTEHGAPSGAPSVYVAPEVAAGTRATPGADVYAFVLLQRSVLGYIELPAALERVFRGELERGDDEVAELIRWVNERVVTAPPRLRASMAETHARYRREWSLLGIELDAASAAERLARLGREPISVAVPSRGELVIGPDARWLSTPSGERYDLAGRGPLRRLLVRLAEHRRDAPGAHLDVDALLEAGWPGERPLREAGLNRVYVALSTLRKLGLRDAIERDPTGYRIDPELPVRLATSS